MWLLSSGNPFKPFIVYRMFCFGHHSTKQSQGKEKKKDQAGADLVGFQGGGGRLNPQIKKKQTYKHNIA